MNRPGRGGGVAGGESQTRFLLTGHEASAIGLSTLLSLDMIAPPAYTSILLFNFERDHGRTKCNSKDEAVDHRAVYEYVTTPKIEESSRLDTRVILCDVRAS
jgi:hypothetical protein